MLKDRSYTNYSCHVVSPRRQTVPRHEASARPDPPWRRIARRRMMVLTRRWMMIRNGAALAESYVRTTVCMVLAGTLLASCTSSVFSNPSGAANDSTGFSVGISGDTAIVGVRGSGTNNAGKALVYQRSGTAWALQATLTSSTPSNEAAFGWSVGISGDRAIVGALTDASLGYVSGAAYIFERNGGTWTRSPASSATARRKPGSASPSPFRATTPS